MKKMEKVIKFIFAFAILLSSNNIKAQTATAVVKLFNKDTVACDAVAINLQLEIKLNHEASIYITYQVDGDKITPDPIPYADIVANGNKISLSGATLSLKPNERYATHTIKLVSISTQNMTSPQSLDASFNVELFATPTPEIKTDSVGAGICGLETQLIANNKWNDISIYHWSSNIGSITDADKEIGHLKLDNNQTASITLTETTGGKCSSSTTKNITMLGTPKGFISRNDENGDDNPVVICSALTDDENFDFDFDITAEGYSPFEVTFSNGQKLSNVYVGTSKQYLHNNKSHNLTITKMTDKYGCVATDVDKQGSVQIIDRKPIPQLPSDTLNYNINRNIQLSVDENNERNTYEWQLAPSYLNYDAWFDNNQSNETSFNTNIDGIISIQCIEKNKYMYVNNKWLTYDRECVDTAFVNISVEVPVNYPNGISPNNDGHNDKLVIEGLPANNTLIICDSKGKKIYEKENYRNDWDAEGVEDGYYYYIVKSGNSKLVTETLVIKRSVFTE